MLGLACPRRRLRRLLLLLSPLLLLAAGTLRAETPEEIFSRGNAAYEEQRYAEAAEAWIDVAVDALRARWERAIPRRLEKA